MVKKIPLGSRKYPGHYALVDDEDFDFLNQWKWYAKKGRYTFYACKSGSSTKKPRPHYKMHRCIMGYPKGMVDHINGNGLDNRRCNLRIVTPRQNCQNQHVKRASKYPGVRFHSQNKNWIAEIQTKGIRRHLGVYKTEKEAFKAYRAAVHELGEKLVCELGGE